MAERKIGFVAFWKSTDMWYKASKEEKKEFDNRVNEIFSECIAKGVEIFGPFDCSWSSEWRYFSFWKSPNLEIVEDACRKLVECGDINKYNIQRHFVGRECDGSTDS